MNTDDQAPIEPEVTEDTVAEEAAAEVSESTVSEPTTEEEQASPEEPPTVEEELMKWRDTAMRTAAELENYRKRMAREKQDSIRYANQRLLEELLPVIDNFEMGMMAAQNEKESMIYMGMNMVQKQLSDFFENLGVTPVKMEGAFDPTIHDAVSEEETEGVEPGTIIRVARRGYTLNDRLLRPASVVVAKGAEASEEAEPASSEEEESNS